MKYDFEKIKSLVDAEVSENKTLDFKQEWKDLKDRINKQEFLKDITAMANTEGGVIVYGVEEDNGKAKAAIGVTISDSEEKLRQQIQNIVETNTDPKLVNIQVDLVPGDNGKTFIVINIPQSWNAPHRITLNKNPFYKRYSEDNKPMDTFELRSEFVFSQRVDNAIKNFHDNRIESILGGDTPIPIDTQQPAVVLHIIPKISMKEGVRFGDNLETELKEFSPIHGDGYSLGEYNLEGYLKMLNKDPTWSYAQFYRTGIIEASLLSVCFNTKAKTCDMECIESELYKKIFKYTEILDQLSIARPFVIYLSLLNMLDFELTIPPALKQRQARPHKSRSRHLHPSNFLLQETNQANKIQEIDNQLKFCFNQLWNGFGYPHSLFFTDMLKKTT